MPKSDQVRIVELNVAERKFVSVCDTIKTLFVCVVVGVLGWGAIEMLKLGLTTDASHLTALAQCLEKWNVMDVLLLLASIVSGSGWYWERQRNKRLVKKEGDLRREKESSDPVSSRSGLNKTGDAPED